MPRSREHLPVDEAIRILEDSGYTVERHGMALYYVCDPSGTTNFYKLSMLREEARGCVQYGVKTQKNFVHPLSGF